MAVASASAAIAADVSFFDAVVDLIPTQYYIRDAEAEAQAALQWSKYHRVRTNPVPVLTHTYTHIYSNKLTLAFALPLPQNRKGAAPKQRFKDARRKRQEREAKFDTAQHVTVTQKQQQLRAAKPTTTTTPEAASAAATVAATVATTAVHDLPKGGSVQALKARLQARIAAKRAERKAQPGQTNKHQRQGRKRANSSDSAKPDSEGSNRKRKRQRKPAAAAAATPTIDVGPLVPSDVFAPPQGTPRADEPVVVPEVIDYGVIKFDTDGAGAGAGASAAHNTSAQAGAGAKKKKKKSLEQMLAKVRGGRPRRPLTTGNHCTHVTHTFAHHTHMHTHLTLCVVVPGQGQQGAH